MIDTNLDADIVLVDSGAVVVSLPDPSGAVVVLKDDPLTSGVVVVDGVVDNDPSGSDVVVVDGDPSAAVVVSLPDPSGAVIVGVVLLEIESLPVCVVVVMLSDPVWVDVEIESLPHGVVVVISVPDSVSVEVEIDPLISTQAAPICPLFTHC